MSDPNRDPRPSQCQGWAWSNYGLLRGVVRTRRDAIAAVEKETGENWRTAKKYMEVWKCQVVAR